MIIKITACLLFRWSTICLSAKLFIIHVRSLFLGDFHQGAPSRPMTPHWSVSMGLEVWWTAGFGMRSEGHPHCSPHLVFHAHTNHILHLDRSSIPLTPRCIPSPSLSASTALREKVVISADEGKLRHGSQVISSWTCGCVEEHVSCYFLHLEQTRFSSQSIKKSNRSVESHYVHINITFYHGYCY